jgi:phage baseplate assembly protein W
MQQVLKNDPAKLLGQGISFPFRLGPDGRVAWSSGAANVRESVKVILMTENRERIMLPEFGTRLQTYLFEPNTPATRRLLQKEIEEALPQWEPRLQLESVNVDADSQDDRAAVVTIRYRLRATQALEQTAVRLQLGA